MPKHYYSDDGILQFDQNRGLLIKLAKAFNLEDMQVEENRKMTRLDIVEKATEIICEYQCRQLNPSRIPEWREEIDVNPVTQALKEIFFDAIDRGFLHNEFLLIAWNAMAEIQCYAIGLG